MKNTELTVSEVLQNLSEEELNMIEKGKSHWSMDILNKKQSGHITSETIKELINLVIENTWVQSKIFYNKNKE